MPSDRSPGLGALSTDDGASRTDRAEPPTETDPEGSYRPVRHLWLVQVAVGLGVLVTTSDSSGVNISLYTLASTFQLSTATVSWMILLGFLIVTSTLFLFGRLSDQFGNKEVFVSGFIVYGLGAALAGFATSFPVLLACRCIQSLGVSLLSANSSAILTECFPPSRRGAAMGVNSTVVGAGFFVGPLLGGFALSNLDWRYVFWLNVPIALVGFVVCLAVLPPTLPERRKAARFDVPGVVLCAAATVCLLLGLNQSRTLGWSSPVVPGLVAAAILLGVAFVAVERRSAQPMVEVSLFSNRLFSLSLLSACLVFLGLSAQDLLVPLFVQQVLQLSPATAAAVAATLALVRTTLASPTGWLADRVGTQWLSAGGAALIAVGIFSQSRMGDTTLLPLVLGLAILIGAEWGIYFSPNMFATMTSVPADRLGMAAGALGFRRNLGQSAGAAIAAGLVQSGVGVSAAELASSFQLAFLFGAVAVTCGCFASALAGSTPILRPARAR